MAEGHRPISGSVSVIPAVARMMNSAARLTGTETSCLIEPE
jgi:hypothetical protein